MPRLVTAVVGALTCTQALAQAVGAGGGPASAAAQPALPSALGRVLEVGGGLAVVLVVIALGAMVARRALPMRTGGLVRLQVVGTVSLGARERLVLVDVEGRRVLVGVAPGRVSCVADIGESAAPVEPIEQDAPSSAVERVVAGSAFDRLLALARREAR